MSHIIILNGTSSAGKSSIAKSLQKILKEDYLHFPMDSFLNMIPERSASYEMAFTVSESMIKSAFVFLQSGHNLILDIVNLKGFVRGMRDVFHGHIVSLVKVHAPLDVLNKREKARGDREIGLAAHQFDHVHEDVVYDFEIDTADINADTAAKHIADRFALYLNV